MHQGMNSGMRYPVGPAMNQAPMGQGYMGQPNSSVSVNQNANIVNHLASFIETHGLERQGIIAELYGKKIGVDGCKLIDNVNKAMRREERLSPLTNPVPFCAYTEIGILMERLAKMNAEYVFPGMNVSMNPKDKESQKVREHNVTVLSLNGKAADQVRLQRAGDELNAILDEDGENYIFTYMKLFPELKVTRAPYLTWAQLASYLSKGVKYMDEVYGCIEMLAFRGVHRVIVRLEDSFYYYVTKDELLAHLQSYNPAVGINEDDLPFLFALSSSHKMLNDPQLPASALTHLIPQLQRDRNNGKLILLQNRGSPTEARAYRYAAIIEHCPVLTPSGECVPLSQLYEKRVSKKLLKLLFGSPLPPLIYYLQMTGLLHPAVPSAVATKQIVDAAPAVDSAEFRQVAEFIIPLRTQIVFQLVQSMNQSPIELVWIRRYNTHSGTGREMPILQPPQIRLDEWNTSLFVPPGGVGAPFYFSDVTALAANAASTATYHNTDQALAAVLLKALDLLGYFTHATQTNSQEVSGPSVYTTALECCLTNSLSEYAVLLIELIRTKTLTDKPLVMNSAQRGAMPNVPSSNAVLFAYRLLSIYPFRLKSSWTSPILNADLAGFNGMARSLQRTLRSLVEVISVITLIESRGRAFSLEQYQKEIQPRLPFGVPIMSCGGLIVQYIMENAMPGLTLDNVQAAFPDCLNLAEDLGMMFYFWYYTGRLIHVLYGDDPELMQTYQLYNQANFILAKMAVQLLGPSYSILSS